MKAPYSLIPIGLLALLLYLASYGATRLGILSTSTHRKIWNSLLLVTFITTACLGIILAIQVNYKLKIRFIEELLTWHVDFGIGMTVIALFHFSWHIRYYLEIIRKGISGNSHVQLPDQEKERLPSPESIENIRSAAKWPVIALGISAIGTQIILLREFLSVFYGNELVLGIVLANWMILTGFGSYLGKFSVRIRDSRQFIFFALVLIGIIPIITIFMLNFLKNIVFLEGSLISLTQVFASSAVMMLPFCILSGFMFTFLSQQISQQEKKNLIGQVYSMEAIGSVIGGILLNLILIFFLKTFQSLVVILTIDLLVAVSLPGKRKPAVLIPVGLIYLAILLLTFAADLDKISKQFLFRNQELLFLKETPYGSLAITETGNQLNFYENNVLLFNTLNTIENEEAVHYAMLQHNDPEFVLLISGGISGILDEVLKYDVTRIDYIEINPWLIRAAREFHEVEENEKIRIINRDARLFIRNRSASYDVVLINLPPPGSAHINRYYTIEFFNELSQRLNPDAIVATSLPSTMNYLSDEAAEVNSILYNTLGKVFEHVTIIPGEQNFFLASSGEISNEIAHLAEERGIQTDYVNQYYIDDQLLGERCKIILKSLDNTAGMNRDFTPIAYMKQIAYWLSYFKINYWIVWGLCFVIFLFIVIRLNPISLGMFAGGFAASSIEIILLFSFQIIYGYIYHVTGIIITLFMAGLAIGAWYRARMFPVVTIRRFIVIQVAIGVFAFTLPVFFILFRHINPGSGLIHFIFFVLTITIAVLTGFEFSMATVLQKGSIRGVSASIYSADLMGSALGALVISALLLPLLGISKVTYIVGGVNLLAALFTWIKRKSY